MVKNPITDHLPIGCKKIGMSFKAEKCVDPRTLVPSDDPIVFVVGAMAHGSVSFKTFKLKFYNEQKCAVERNSSFSTFAQYLCGFNAFKFIYQL